MPHISLVASRRANSRPSTVSTFSLPVIKEVLLVVKMPSSVDSVLSFVT